MKLRHYLRLALLAACCAGPGDAVPQEPPAASGPVYVIPIEGPIEPALLYVIRRGVTEAADQDAAAIVFRMDTPGGTLGAAREIVNLIENIEVPTYTFVEQEAFSAGAIIALATDTIYMAPGSVIGDAMPIMMSPFAGPQEMPDDLQEKMVSAVSALIRSAAEQGGHDPELAEAMVRRENEYKVGDEVICKAGELLTLTNTEAERPVGEDQRPLLSAGTVQDLEAMLERIGLPDAETRELEITGAERLARMIQALSVLFLGAGLLGIYIEIKTPGLGLPGMLGVTCLAIWFYGHHIAGLAGMEELVIIVLGIGLLLVEVFVLPGFGIAGFAGLALILTGILMAMVERYPGGPALPRWEQFEQPVQVLAMSFVGAAVIGVVIGRFLPESQLFKPLRLDASASRTAGYSSSKEERNLVGLAGRAVTALRPAGAAQFGDRRLDVVTEGAYLDKDTPVRIVQVHGNRIVVEPSA